MNNKNNLLCSLHQVENFLNCVTLFFKTKNFTEYLKNHLN